MNAATTRASRKTIQLCTTTFKHIRQTAHRHTAVTTAKMKRLQAHQLQQPDTKRAKYHEDSSRFEMSRTVQTIATDLQNADTVEPQPETSLTDLPGELLDRIALFLTREDLNAFRLTANTIQLNTTNEFAKKNVTNMTVVLTEACLSTTVDILQYDDMAAHVKKLELRSHTPWVPLTSKELDLLHKLLAKSTSATHFELSSKTKGISMNYGEAVVTKQVFNALLRHPLPSLTGIHVERCALSCSNLLDVLTSYSKTLETVCLRDIISQGNGDWPTVLAGMRDAGHRLKYVSLHRLKGILDFDRRINKFLRSPNTNKLEQYALYRDVAELYGEWAVKVGLNKVLEQAGSAL